MAEQAVARGITWLNANVPGWRAKIDVASLDLSWPCHCVLGQLDGDFYQAVWERQLTKDQVYDLGLSASKSRGTKFSTLTAAWRRALRRDPQT